MNAPLPGQEMPAFQPRPMPAALLAGLRAHFGERCSTAAAVCDQHGRDESPFAAMPPEAVVFC